MRCVVCAQCVCGDRSIPTCMHPHGCTQRYTHTHTHRHTHTHTPHITPFSLHSSLSSLPLSFLPLSFSLWCSGLSSHRDLSVDYSILLSTPYTHTHTHTHICTNRHAHT